MFEKKSNSLPHLAKRRLQYCRYIENQVPHSICCEKLECSDFELGTLVNYQQIQTVTWGKECRYMTPGRLWIMSIHYHTPNLDMLSHLTKFRSMYKTLPLISCPLYVVTMEFFIILSLTLTPRPFNLRRFLKKIICCVSIN